ncbi:uncharacterized protein cp110 isoform X2 [Echeneis naucrates]|uniref:uncharacterized protein cp110 isoform X2 n=1 Tax=Echeneis naucrates TaxID=173247 RepID=UPI001113B930|nr:uncharacterized protein LOC115046752 isoform X2 [Echeneis naucrates]
MEDYDRFVQRCLSRLRESEAEEHGSPSVASSVIRLHGRPIPPPLLSEEQRAEMRQHREAAQKAADHRKLKEDPRFTFVQTILNSVQLRKTPTLDELLQESENRTSLSSQKSTGRSVPESTFFIGTQDRLSHSPPPLRQGKDGPSLLPSSSTSTMYSAVFTSDVMLQQTYYDGCLDVQHDSQQQSQPGSHSAASHQSPCSGYVSQQNVKNATDVSEMIDAGSETHGCGSTEGAPSLDGFYLYGISNRIAKVLNIISHPPIDGEELERSGLEPMLCNDFPEVKSMSCSFQEDSDKSNNLPFEQSEISLDSTESEDSSYSSTVANLNKDRTSEDPVSSSDNTGFSDNLETPGALSVHGHPASELHSQKQPTEAQPADNHIEEAKPSEEPYRLSLQALLKKSQEYRRHQRMLRNQAKNTKTQERPRARAEEHSLSDKENDDSLYKATLNAEKKESKDTYSLTEETSLKNSCENERMSESEEKTNLESKSTHKIEGGNPKEMTETEEERTFQNNKVNSSQEAITESKQTCPFIQQQSVSTEASPVQTDIHLTSEQNISSPKSNFKVLGKYQTIPAPSFCRSPVRFKSKVGIANGEPLGRAKPSKGNLVVNNSMTEQLSNTRHQNSHTTVPSTVNLMAEGSVTNMLTKSSTHIDQLESSLSSLKVLISDLESTVKENLENHSQTGRNAQSKFSFIATSSEESRNNRLMQPCQTDYGNLEGKLRDGDIDGGVAEKRQWPRPQMLNNTKKTREDIGSESDFGDTDILPLFLQEKRKEDMDVRELRLVKTIAAERVKEGPSKEGIVRSFGVRGSCRTQLPPAKCILSAAQQMRIPEAFRNVPSKTLASCNVSVLLDTSNHPVERRNEMAVEGHGSTHSPSLNLSYDVDTPSGLWLLEGPGSDLGSKGHLVQEKHLTPESGGGGQGGVSKVKRRLLMHTTEETQETGAENSGRADGVVTPSSSTPRAAVRWYKGHENQKNKEEQLKQVYAAQVRALQDEHRRQQEELLQALAARYRLLQSMSFPCSMSTSRLRDTLTFSTLSQSSSTLSERYRPLLSAAIRGFLTRRLLRTDRVAQLVRTIRDTQKFLLAFQRQSPGRGEFWSRQDLLLQERVTLQLRAARYEVYDIFFSLSAGERMQLISWDRELARERELKRQTLRTSQWKEVPVSCNTEIAGEEKRNDDPKKGRREESGGCNEERP